MIALGVLVALSVAELRRLLAFLVWRPPIDPVFTLAWSSGAAAIKPPLDAPTTSNNAENCDCRTRSLTGKSVQVRRCGDASR